MTIRHYETEQTREYAQKRQNRLSCALVYYNKRENCRDRFRVVENSISSWRIYHELYIHSIRELLKQLPERKLIDLSIDGIGQWRRVALELLLEDDNLDVDDARYLYDRLLVAQTGNNDKRYFDHWDLLNERYICPGCEQFVTEIYMHQYEVSGSNWLDPPEDRYTCEDGAWMVYDEPFDNWHDNQADKEK
jgi:hypothetical protein